jgi:hypothetical protein
LIITKKHDSTYGIDTTILPVNIRNYLLIFHINTFT